MTPDDADAFRKSRGELRAHLRTLRRALSREQQDRAAAALHAGISKLDCYRDSGRIAFYIAIDGEASPALLLRDALAAGKSCYLPRVASAEKLDFIAHKAGDQLVESGWGIPEPMPGETIEPHALDLAIVPLVGFSRECGRLGNGKGFYDRAFAFRRRNPQLGPMLLGLGHECQLLDLPPMRAWDVPLDAVATPARVYWRGGADRESSD